MKVITKIEFYGRKEKRIHHVGESFDVTPERFKEIEKYVQEAKKEKVVG